MFHGVPSSDRLFSIALIFTFQILPPTDYEPDKVKAYGPGLENGVNPKEVTHFTVDTSEAGKLY